MKFNTDNNVDYIFQMVEETMSEAKPLSSNQMEFDFNNDLHLIEGTYNTEKMCYSININGLELEFPENWGPFKDSRFFCSKVNDDPYLLIPILEQILGQNVSEINFKCLKSHIIIEVLFAQSLLLVA